MSIFLRRTFIVVAALGLSRTPGAGAFPPYRSTDADTAGPGTVEIRFGGGRIEREDGDTTFTSPLLRVNLGVHEHFELISELEYDPDRGRLGDGAVGVKWATSWKPVRIGVETLALLPVSSRLSGLGVESQLLVTHRRGAMQVHLNAGAFYDPRAADVERGWRASLLAEATRGRARAGLELFAKRIHGEPVVVQGGPGIIFDLGAADVRTGVHAGLTSPAPDLMVSLWVTWKWKLWHGSVRSDEPLHRTALPRRNESM